MRLALALPIALPLLLAATPAPAKDPSPEQLRTERGQRILAAIAGYRVQAGPCQWQHWLMDTTFPAIEEHARKLLGKAPAPGAPALAACDSEANNTAFSNALLVAGEWVFRFNVAGTVVHQPGWAKGLVSVPVEAYSGKTALDELVYKAVSNPYAFLARERELVDPVTRDLALVCPDHPAPDGKPRECPEVPKDLRKTKPDAAERLRATEAVAKSIADAVLKATPPAAN